MARRPQVIERRYTWGIVRYDTVHHRFSYTENMPRSGEPYAGEPVVLNVVVTRSCNMDCDYCVAKDFAGVEDQDLVLSRDMLHWMQQSPFMLLVLTGGEPLMPPYDSVSMKLIESSGDRGVILDTNGTYLPDRKTLLYLKKHGVMVRVSMDAVRPSDEITARHILKGAGLDDESAHHTKMENIDRFVAAGVYTAVQTVVWQSNTALLDQMIGWLADHRVKRWYLQRLIPSHKYKRPPPRRTLDPDKYYSLVTGLVSKANSEGIECVAKMDKRHNSVFLLMGDGMLYTQGAAPGQKVPLGDIREEFNYFEYVSAADHACRYYLSEPPKDRAAADVVRSLAKVKRLRSRNRRRLNA